ncbi:HpcH/HpaI aldolase/citrate lyase family protein [uncultured Aliiroseovarius sp.]|uniref:HpcH/HpaI aldolase/citrate lyase family protein n=1 Tax=uncultured Aliiroseovarius sp. TaxID=1658783 RepID=UPI0025952A61|nr:HpcH/HpaI aldolase/citrate lyase family protein [uncultured Aliiroseovarius sp.]
MTAPKNIFKSRLKIGETQIGLWVAMGHPAAAESCGFAGFDWLVIDAEHGPNGLAEVLAQLRALRGSSHPVVRVRENNRGIIKQMLDVGAQTLLIPMIESAEEARQAVRSMLYPPTGVRGVGASLVRASDFGNISNYLHTANDEICVLLQVESVRGIEALDEILRVEGVDGVFIGPADLAADMGLIGNSEAPEVRTVVDKALKDIKASGKAAGILTADLKLALHYAEMGVEFLAVGSDVGVFTAGLRALRQQFA